MRGKAKGDIEMLSLLGIIVGELAIGLLLLYGVIDLLMDIRDA